MTKQTLLIVGCGQLGNAMAPYLTKAEHWLVYGMRRNAANIADDYQPLAADYTDRAALSHALEELRPDYIVLTLTPSSRSAEGYEKSYLLPIKNMLAELKHRPRHVIFVSSTSVYAQCESEWVDETSVTEPSGYSGETMLACEQLLNDSGLSFTALRCGGIYGSGEGRLLSQIKAGRFSGSTHYTNRIHFQDCAASIVHLLEKHRQDEPVDTMYLGVDSEPCQKIELERWLAEQLAVPFSQPSAVSESSERRPGSKRCSNKRLLQSGFQFTYPSYKEGYMAMIKNRR